jgi:hypothetical protein
MMTNGKFNYGDEVNLRQTDDSGRLINKACSVVGITPVETEEQSRVFGYPTGTVLYTVEFGDGSDKLVPEDQLSPTSFGDGRNLP